MKRLITASALFTIIIVMCFLVSMSINKSFLNIENTVQEIETDLLNGKDINNERISEINKQWNNKSKFLCAFINREHLTEISRMTATLSSLYENDKNEFLCSLKELSLLLKTIRNTETINFYGIL